MLVNLSMNTEGFPYETWYNMPVYLRRYYVNVIEKRAKETQQDMEMQKRNISTSMGIK